MRVRTAFEEVGTRIEDVPEVRRCGARASKGCGEGTRASISCSLEGYGIADAGCSLDALHLESIEVWDLGCKF